MNGRKWTRPPTLIPPSLQRKVLDQFTKADLAELSWDFARQEAGGDEASDEAVLELLYKRRSDIIRSWRA